MAHYFKDTSHTFSEYLLVPGYSACTDTPQAVSLKTPLARFKKGQKSHLTLNIPMVSAIMQAVSGPDLAVALAQAGGMSFIYGSQPIEDEAAMVRSVKSYKAGVVISDSNLRPDSTLADVLAIKEKTGHSAMPVTQDGSATGKLLGIVTSRDYRLSRDSKDKLVKDFMTPASELVCASNTVSLDEANDIIWEKKINQLPLVDKQGNLAGLVFRRDYDFHKSNPLELLDAEKRYRVGAGINTHDYKERVPALIAAGVDALCIDSSEGFSEWQAQTLAWVRKNCPKGTIVGAGNVVDASGFRFLAEAGADFVKVGIGGGSICITREQKGIGRGQASALIDVCQERDRYFKETGIYVPVCSDGGIVYDYHMTLALAMGADFLMLGRYFARFDEAPSARVTVNGNYMKEYWGEGSFRARNWQRYDAGGAPSLKFAEGVDSYVPYAGSLRENLSTTLAKISSTMANCGSLTLKDLRKNAKLTLVSATSLVEGSAHDVVLKESSGDVTANYS